VRQRGCRASRAHDPARGIPLTRLVTGMPGVECHHLLDWVPYLRVMRVAQRVECGSVAAAPAVLTIQHVVFR